MIETLFIVAMVYAIFAQLLTEYRISKEIYYNRINDNAKFFVYQLNNIAKMKKMVKSN